MYAIICLYFIYSFLFYLFIWLMFLLINLVCLDNGYFVLYSY